MPSHSHSDLATLAHLARDGSLDLTSVAFRVRTDLLVSSPRPVQDEIKIYVEFGLAALPGLGERDLKIIAQKLAEWPHTPADLKAAFIKRLPALESLFPPAPKVADQSRVAPVIFTAEVVAANHDADQKLRAALYDNNTGQEKLPGREAQPGQDEQPIQAAYGSTTQAVEDEPDGEIDLPLSGDVVGQQIEQAQKALLQGNAHLAEALLARADLRAADHAPFFLIANAVQQSLILSGLEQLQKLQPRTAVPRPERSLIEALMATASTDRAGAFIDLAEHVGGSPEFAAAMTLDTSRKLTGLAFLGMGASVEDAVRFSIKLGDQSSASVSVIFGLVEILRLATPATALRLVRAIGGKSIQPAGQQAKRHIPVADPSGTPIRGGAASLAPHDKRGAVSPLDLVRKLTAG